MNMTSTKAIEVFAKEIKKYIQGCLKTACFNKTKRGLVISVLDNNKYIVKIMGTDYTVPSCTSDSHTVGDNVLVLFVQNDSKRKYIIGKA